MKKNFTLSLFAMILFCGSLIAQDKTNKSAESNRLQKLSEKLEGTYQIQIVNYRKDIAYHLGLMDTIVQKRHQTQTVYHKVNDYVRVLILPYSEINKTDFVRLERKKHVFENHTN